MKRLSRRQLVKALREGGKVERAHTHAHIGSYTVGQHSFDLACILIALKPEPPSAALLRAALTHDVPERWIGDSPAWAKWASPNLRKCLDELERRVVAALGIGERLTKLESKWLRAADRLELWIWAHEQVRMGNLGADQILDNLEGYFEREPPPDELREFMTWYASDKARSPDALP